MKLVFGEEFYPLREAAHMAGVSPNRLYRLRRDGILAATPIMVGNRWEFHVTPRAVLEALNTPVQTPPKAGAKTPPSTASPRDVAQRDAAAREVLRSFGLNV